MSRSLFSDERECLICGDTRDVHKHHIYPGAGRRQISEREGCWCYLCARHHNMSNQGVHFNKTLDEKLRKECERRWLVKNSATKEDFLKVFGVNYL